MNSTLKKFVVLFFISLLLLASSAPEDSCLVYHQDSKLKTREGRSVSISEEKFSSSVHAQVGLACIDCHQDLQGVEDFPHPEKLSEVKCSLDPSSRVSRKNIINTCGQCHLGIKHDYLEGVHGQAFLKGSHDVPVCTDCHSEHSIQAPQFLSSSVYPTKVAKVCSRCHDNEALSQRYGFLTSRLKTYSRSYHGIASRFGETKVANCTSCHGFHDIRPSSDPKSSINPKNLPQTCGKCHPGAGVNFTKGKIHVISEKLSNKWAYYVRIFYIILISSIISFFLIFILVDLGHRLQQKFQAK